MIGRGVLKKRERGKMTRSTLFVIDPDGFKGCYELRLEMDRTVTVVINNKLQVKEIF